jgi:hypothetical protein
MLIFNNETFFSLSMLSLEQIQTFFLFGLYLLSCRGHIYSSITFQLLYFVYLQVYNYEFLRLDTYYEVDSRYTSNEVPHIFKSIPYHASRKQHRYYSKFSESHSHDHDLFLKDPS